MSVSMVQDSRSSKEGVKSFDFSSTSSVMQILKVLRAHTEITSETRNEIRDLIFSYTNSKGDEGVRQTIESRLLAVGITPESIASSSVPSANKKEDIQKHKKQLPQAGFAGGRNIPDFKNTTLNTSSSPAKSASANEPKNSEITSNPKSKIQPVIPTVSPAADLKVSSPQDAPVTNENSSVIAKEANIKNVQPTPPNPPVAQEIDIPKKEIVTSLDTTELLERIRVIKADINDKAGNPVNLVSINNEIGREYMTALLEAMKQLSSGKDTAIDSAMKRLEIAYEQALSVIEMANPAPGNSSATPAKSSTASPSSVVTTNASNLSQKQPATSSSKTDLNKLNAKPASSQSVPTEPSSGVTSNLPVQRAPHVEPKTNSVPPHQNPPLGATKETIPPRTLQKTDAPTVQTPPAPKPQKTTKTPTQIPVANNISQTLDDTKSPTSIPIHSSKYTPAKSVAEATPLRKVEELPTLAQVKNRSESGNPLYTGEVNDGLEQLLSEWSIFRKSGVFGTGPRGSSHPLFKKLSGLKIPLIIAGRFEGATEEVRQSITDYMNGWRYEQGIIYEKDETFEEYLRRVVRHIIDTK